MLWGYVVELCFKTQKRIPPHSVNAILTSVLKIYKNLSEDLTEWQNTIIFAVTTIMITTIEIINDMEKVTTTIGQVVCLCSQEDTESYATKTGGDVVLMRRRPGERCFRHLGGVSLPYTFSIKDMDYPADVQAVGVHSLAELGEEIENMKRLFEGTEELEDARVGVSPEAVDAVLSLQAGDVACLVWDGGSMEFHLDAVLRAHETSWRDFDDREYRIGVAPSVEG